jgi:thiol-disulfide isomerase/thioredoxin
MDHICREETDAIENRIASLPDIITAENQESVLKQMKLISLGMSYLKMTLMLFLSDMQEITPAELKLQAQVITVDVRASGFTDFQAFTKGSRSISVAVFIDFCRRIYPILLTLSENYPPIYLTIDTDKRRARLLLEDKSLVSLLPLDSSMTILEDDDALILEWKEKDNA